MTTDRQQMTTKYKQMNTDCHQMSTKGHPCTSNQKSYISFLLHAPSNYKNYLDFEKHSCLQCYVRWKGGGVPNS